MMYIPIILGTAREGRNSEKAAEFMLQQLQSVHDVETEILDVRDYRLPATTRNKEDEIVKKYTENIAKADGLVVVCPEYNHGYPGEFKMMFDMAYEEYHRKPIGICGTSMGPFGGLRVVEQVRLIALETQMVPIRNAMYFGNIGNAIDESYQERVKPFLEELLWYAKALKQAREQS